MFRSREHALPYLSDHLEDVADDAVYGYRRRNVSDDKNVPAEAGSGALALSIEMNDVGAGDRLPYTKADFALVCHVGENFALSFYQIDYQAVITQKQISERNGANGIAKIVAQPMPVAKVVLDRDGFKRLHADLTTLLGKLPPGR